MSFQAYLDSIEDKTGLTPRQLIDQAHDQGLDEDTKSAEIADWLKRTHGLGHGHAMALVHVVKNGPQINSKHVGATGSHRDESAVLWLDGKANKPAR